MRSRLIKFIPFAEVQNDLFWILQRIFEIDEVEHEITYRIENDILGQTLWNSHCLCFLLFICTFISASCRIASILFITTPKFILECLTPHEITSFVHNLLVIIFFFFCGFSFFLFFFLDCFLKSLIQNFLQNAFPNIFFLPYTMIVYILG